MSYNTDRGPVCIGSHFTLTVYFKYFVPDTSVLLLLVQY